MFKGLLRNTLTLRPNIIYESRHSLVCDLPLLCCRLMVFSQLFYWHTEYNRRLRTRPLNISELPIIEYLDDVKGASKDVRSDVFLAKNISVLLDHNQTTLHNHLRATDYRRPSYKLFNSISKHIFIGRLYSTQICNSIQFANGRSLRI